MRPFRQKRDTVEIIKGTGGFACHECLLTATTAKAVFGDIIKYSMEVVGKPEDMLLHLEKHLNAGHVVPPNDVFSLIHEVIDTRGKKKNEFMPKQGTEE